VLFSWRTFLRRSKRINFVLSIGFDAKAQIKSAARFGQRWNHSVCFVLAGRHAAQAF
jgi:hypothetical protein